MIMDKITKEHEDKDMVMVMAEEEEAEAIITISTIMKGAINHIEVEEEQEEEVIILDQMREGMISLMLNVTTVTNLGIVLGNVMVQLIMLRSKSMLSMTSKKPKSPSCW